MGISPVLTSSQYVTVCNCICAQWFVGVFRHQKTHCVSFFNVNLGEYDKLFYSNKYEKV